MLKINKDKTINIYVHYDSDKLSFKIIDGECHLYWSRFALDFRTRIFRYINKAIYGNSNIFVRAALSKLDYEHLQNGTHRGSINHATDEEEGGLSVAYTLEFPSKYQYFLTGDIIGTGTDGEPLLDPKTVKLLSKPLNTKAFYAKFAKHQAECLKKLDIQDDAYHALISYRKYIICD